MTTLLVSAVKLLIYELKLGHEDQWPHTSNTHFTKTYCESCIIELPKNYF